MATSRDENAPINTIALSSDTAMEISVSDSKVDEKSVKRIDPLQMMPKLLSGSTPCVHVEAQHPTSILPDGLKATSAEKTTLLEKKT